MRHSLLLPTAQYIEHGQSGAPILSLIKVTASSILEVVILSSVGYILARRGIIDKRTQTKINKLNVSFFTPALLFSKVAFTLNPARLAELIIVPLGFVIVTVVSTLSALVLSWTARLSPAQRNFAIACAISPNSNSLPVALMQSLAVTVPQLHWDEEGEPEDTVDGMLGRALTYLVLFSTLGMFLRWSVGAKLLSSVEENVENESASETTNPSPQSSSSENDAPHARPSITLRRPTGERRPTRTRSGPPAWARSFPNSPDANAQNYGAARGDDANDSDVEDEPLEPYEEEGQITLPGATNSRENRSCWKVFTTTTRKWFHNLVLRPLYAIGGFMTAPLYAAVISLIVAVIPPLQKFVDSLEPVVGALETAGACSIPLTMVVLGAYFVADASAVQQVRQGSIPKAVPPSAPAGDGSTSATGPQPTAPEGVKSAVNGEPGEVEDDPWRRASLESSTASGESTLVQSKDTKRKGLGSWMGKNPWNSGSSNGGSDIEEARYVEEPASYTQPSSSNSPNSPLLSGDADEAARNADLNSRNSAGRYQNALSKQASVTTMERRTIAVAISSRMILTPLILLPFVAWYAMATASNVMDDPVFVACACLIIGSPPALTLAQITSQSAQGNPSFERLISKTIFTAYTFLAAPTTIALVLTALVITENDKNKG